ncbi:trehalose-phosphatase [Arhodomonas sp. SL1]|uniref:trehalose-phosphatase n=1 Tax=Arhodomonas sp. SL1 TaxID=3425691 RepID=UPI003F8844C9
MPKPPAIATDWALFLDFDGTLVPLAEHPDAVQVPDHLPERLAGLQRRLDGAVAVISGRPIHTLDRLLAPARLALAGVHGLERRGADGTLHHPPDPSTLLGPACRELEAFARAHPGVYWEDKRHALAAHYRHAPAAGPALRALLESLAHGLGGGYEVLSGKFVHELRPAGFDKGSAVRAFMAEPPFAGRRPAFVGDDRTDEDAFSVVNALDGYSIRVDEENAPTVARYRLDNAQETLKWLDALPTPP